MITTSQETSFLAFFGTLMQKTSYWCIKVKVLNAILYPLNCLCTDKEPAMPVVYGHVWIEHQEDVAQFLLELNLKNTLVKSQLLLDTGDLCDAIDKTVAIEDVKIGTGFQPPNSIFSITFLLLLWKSSAKSWIRILKLQKEPI